MAEALAKAEGEQDMEKKIEAALACPCLGALPRSGAVLGTWLRFARRHGLLPSRFACPQLLPVALRFYMRLAARPRAGDLKEGPCGPVFVHAFGCFIRRCAVSLLWPCCRMGLLLWPLRCPAAVHDMQMHART